MLTKKEKEKVVNEIKKKLKSYGTVAIADLSGLPSKQFNAIKKKIRGQAEIVVAKKTLVRKGLEAGGMKELEPFIKGSPALLLTDFNAFKLFKSIKKNKSKTFAKANAVAPSDIVVPAGDTPLTPGPILTELKQLKIEAKIQGTRVVIAKDCLVAKKGEVISDAAAKVLQKLGIEPMEVGLNVVAVLENDRIYPAEVLDVDEAWYLEELKKAYSQAINLAVAAGIYTKESILIMLGKAAAEGNALNKFIEKAKPAAEAARS
ncbi:50S ribosomal protein L10 [Candidatus Micrarchaeota archaeon]|nr:50S ribosomal protein L10 [Candidatus Micrarchaeota archaeon]